MKIIRCSISFILLVGSGSPGFSADPLRVVFPSNLQVLQTNTGPGPAGPTGPGPYHVANMSSQPQRRWMRVTVPKPFADQLPTVCTFVPQGAPQTMAYKGREIGPIGTEFHVLGDLPAFGTQNGQIIAGGTAPVPFQFSEWITDDPSTMEMKLEFVRNSVRQSIPLTFRETLHSSPVARTDRFFGGPVNGFWGEVFLTFYSRQDVVEMQGHFGWCDQSDPAWSTNVESLELKIMEDAEIYFGLRSGFQQIQDGWQLLNSGQSENGKFPHGMEIQAYGVILPKSDSPSTANPPDRAERLAWMQAATEGPLIMTGNATVWDGNWFAFGQVPIIPSNLDGVSLANQSATAFRNFLQNVGGVWDKRPLANDLSTGATGDQPPFGATKGTFAVTVGDPRFLWEMLFSSTDYGLRSLHYREPNGNRVLAQNHPNMVWYDGFHDWRVSSDLLGKPDAWPTNGWNLGRHGPDRQHTGQNYLWAAGALTGSYLIQETARDLIQCELSRYPVRALNTDAPRAGRIFQDWSKMYMILPQPSEQQTLFNLIDLYLHAWEEGWAGKNFSGPVRVMSIDGPDIRVLEPPRKFWVTWNHALGLLGMMEVRALARKFGQTALQTRLENFVRTIASSILHYGTVRNNQNLLWPINGVHALPDGQLQPPSYYNIYAPTGGYRYGVSTTNGSIPGTDLLLGNGGWFSWWAGTIYGGIFLFPTSSFEYQTATEIRNTYTPTTINDAEWHATGQQ